MRRLLNTLYITLPDVYLSADGENVVVLQNEEELKRVPLQNLESIITTGYAGASPALMRKCAEHGVALSFLTQGGRFIARVEGSQKGNVLLRRTQYRIADSEESSVKIARNIIAAKIKNSNGVLKRLVREHPLQIDIDNLSSTIDGLSLSLAQTKSINSLDALRGIEGSAANQYFDAFNNLIISNKDCFRFDTRSKRPPLDPVNAMLSFAYTLATNDCAAALETVGLDPYVGFLHTDRPGRVSLACDLVEEIRAPLCDRFVIGLINKRQINASDFTIKENGAVLMSDEARKRFLTSWQNRKNEELTHGFLKTKIKWGLVPYTQALLLSRYIRGDIDAYPPFIWR